MFAIDIKEKLDLLFYLLLTLKSSALLRRFSLGILNLPVCNLNILFDRRLFSGRSSICRSHSDRKTSKSTQSRVDIKHVGFILESGRRSSDFYTPLFFFVADLAKATFSNMRDRALLSFSRLSPEGTQQLADIQTAEASIGDIEQARPRRPQTGSTRPIKYVTRLITSCLCRQQEESLHGRHDIVSSDDLTLLAGEPRAVCFWNEPCQRRHSAFIGGYIRSRQRRWPNTLSLSIHLEARPQQFKALIGRAGYSARRRLGLPKLVSTKNFTPDFACDAYPLGDSACCNVHPSA